MENMIHLSIEFWKHKWTFGRMRSAVGTCFLFHLENAMAEKENSLAFIKIGL